ncbi:hypothetical protein ES708_17338 [subsurface metagenome]
MGKNKHIIQNSFTEFLLYTTPNGKVKVEIYLKNETVWLTQQKVADLFGVQRSAVTRHLKNIFESGEPQTGKPMARIRDIRSSERRFYQKITDIYAQCSADYDPNEEITKQFFATVQNKLHWAITSQTAAEIIYKRAGGTM